MFTINMLRNSHYGKFCLVVVLAVIALGRCRWVGMGLAMVLPLRPRLCLPLLVGCASSSFTPPIPSQSDPPLGLATSCWRWLKPSACPAFALLLSNPLAQVIADNNALAIAFIVYALK